MDHLCDRGAAGTALRLLMGALVLAACSARSPRPPATAPAAIDAGSVLARVRVREDSVQTLRARFTSVAQHGDEERSAEGVLLVKKPDRFRLRLLSPFGFTVFDYTSVQGELHVELPLQGQRFTNANLPTEGPLATMDLRPAFLRAEAAFPGTCAPQDTESDVLVRCRDATGTLLRTLRIDRASGTVSQEVDFKGGEPQTVTQFGDYRAVGALDLPYLIQMNYPERAVRMTITVRSYEVNPALADDLFESD
jgi:hypothetical protein